MAVKFMWGTKKGGEVGRSLQFQPSSRESLPGGCSICLTVLSLAERLSLPKVCQIPYSCEYSEVHLITSA